MAALAGRWGRWGNARGALASMAGGCLFYNLGMYFQWPLPACWEHGGAGQILTGLAVSFALFVVVSRLSSETENRDRQQSLDSLNKAG